jgi:ABC-2 type transport system ATP-binding protein
VSRAALEAHELTKRYRRRGPLALAAVSLAVPAGSVTGLVGPNGAGKSTLLRTWMGFERPTAGSVSVIGADPMVERAATIGRLAYLAESPALYRELTVADHLAFAAHYRPRFDRERATRRLAELAVPLDAAAGTLSRGQTAQVGLALALGLRAEVLLLDEPLASLDPLARREFIEVLLADVRETGATVVLSSHLVSDVEAACDRLIVLGVGRTMLDDTIERIRSRHRVVAGSPPPGTTLVGRLPGAGDRGVVRLTDGPEDGGVGKRAGLEDVVMAYLAAART